MSAERAGASAPDKNRAVELPFVMGQILVDRGSAGQFLLCHRADAGRDDLTSYCGADVALELARFTDAGEYRPLKTAPNLRHGWRLQLATADELQRALDNFYPGRLAAWNAWRQGALRTTSFRDTLSRQSGMYRVATRITDDQADALIGRFCRSDGGCLRTILWKRNSLGEVPSTLLSAPKYDPAVDQAGGSDAMRVIPLLCQETCNLLVAEARAVVKA